MIVKKHTIKAERIRFLPYPLKVLVAYFLRERLYAEPQSSRRG
jgi:hypothetical protein